MDFPHLNSIGVEKQHWRRVLIDARNRMEAGERIRQNASLVERVLALPELDRAHTVHAYWPMIDTLEVDTRPIIDALRKRGKQIALPVVLSFGDSATEQPRLENRLFTGETNLKPNRWGTYEPVDGAIVSPDALDALIVPALGVDRAGRRIGYGKGYYDELLASCPSPSICPIWVSCLVERLPASPHDMPVDIIATEFEVLRPGHAP